MSLFKNEVGRPSNETIKKRNIFKGICVLLVMVIIGLVGYILNDKGIINLSNKNTKDGNEKVVTTTKKNVDSKKSVLVEDAEKVLYGTFDNLWNFSVKTFNSNVFKTYVAMMKTKTKKFNYTCKELFGNDISAFDDSGSNWTIKTKHDGLEGLLCTDDNTEFYTYDDVNAKYKELFGTGDALKDFIYYGLTENYGYSSSKKVYMGLSCECGDGGYIPIYGVTEAYEKLDKLYIDFVYSIADDENRLHLKDDKMVKLTGDELESKETYKKYVDKLDKYTFTFTKTDNGYIYEKVAEVK